MTLNGYGISENWLNILIMIHVVSAIVGIGFPRRIERLAAGLAKVNAYYWIAAALGVILFLFMFFKPTL